LANVYVNQGKVSEAIELYEQSLEIQKAIGNQQGIAATLNNLASIYVRQNQIDEAFKLFKESLEIRERIGDAEGKAITMWWLGDLAKRRGDFDTALDYLQQSEAILRHIGSPIADQVVEIIQQLQEIRADRSPQIPLGKGD
jgi:pentatricopeptide repeat protein